MFDDIRKICNEAIENKAFPGVSIAYGNHINYNLHSFGNHTYDKDYKLVENTDYFDLASLTKIVVTTTLCKILFDKNKINLNDYVYKLIPEIVKVNSQNKNIQLIHLLSHCSGYDAVPEGVSKNNSIYHNWDIILNSKPIYKIRSKEIYSDTGFIILQKYIERLLDIRYDECIYEYVLKPLGLTMYYNPLDNGIDKNNIIPTIADNGNLNSGLVYDHRCLYLGGYASHAGIFSDINNVAKFCQICISDNKLWSEKTHELFTSKVNLVENSTRALGWDNAALVNQDKYNRQFTVGKYISNNSYGHTGYVGNSLWIDKESDNFFVILSNKVLDSKNINNHNFIQRKYRHEIANCLSKK